MQWYLRQFSFSPCSRVASTRFQYDSRLTMSSIFEFVSKFSKIEYWKLSVMLILTAGSKEWLPEGISANIFRICILTINVDL